MNFSGDDGLPKLKTSEIDEIVNTFKDVYQSALRLTSARVCKLSNNTSNIVISEWSQRNLERGTSTKISRWLLVDSNLKSCFDIDTIDVSHWLLKTWSKSEKFKAVIHTLNVDLKEKIKYYLEIWSEGKSIATFDLAAFDVHGDVYIDDFFSSLSWSNKEDKVIYIAEQKERKTCSFYQQKSSGENDDISINDSGRGQQFVFEDDWGEMLSPKRQPVIVFCDINKQSIGLLNGIPDGISPAQVIYDPSDNGVVGVGFLNKPRRLGIIFCSNRRSHIFFLSNKGKYVILSDDNVAVQSPRFTPDGNYLIWLQRPCGGPHNAAYSLVKYDWNKKKTTVIVDIIQDKVKTKNGKDFFGIFVQALTTRCFTSDSKYLIFSSVQKHRINTYAVDIDNGSIWDIGSNNENESTILLDVSENNFALLNTTSFKEPPVLSSLHIPSAINNFSNELLLEPLTKSNGILDENVIHNFVVTKKSSEGNCFATYYGPQNNKKESVPVVLFPHGGPHTTFSSVFTPAFRFFTKLGFGVLIVHYHGSSGVGQKYINSLLGKIGFLDVEDCYCSLQTALKKFPWLDRKRVVLYGGSHGGFLVMHLSSRYPNDFKAVVARNPVTHVVLACFLSDIPDWAIVEAGFSYKGLADVADNKELYDKMIEMSPIKNVKNVKTPTLLLLGKNDLRVPPSQGLAYYHALKELNVPTKVLFYEDNHSLGRVPVELDSVINSMIWFKRCLKEVTSDN